MSDELRLKKKDAGIYILILHVVHPCRIKTGRLAERVFQKGTYLYIGRAKQYLRGRLARHLRAEKKLFWHIDYLLRRAFIKEIWCQLDFFNECQITARIIETCGKGCSPIPGFGASDCLCPSHLIFYNGDDSLLSSIREEIKLREVRIDDIENYPF